MQQSSTVWSQRLLAARKALKLTRAQLASTAGVSAQTVKAYELGLRHPSRNLLAALLDALKMDRAGRDEIFESAGFAAIGAQIGPAVQPGYRYTVPEAQKYVNSLPWPSFVVDDLMRVVVANVPAQAVWGVNLARDIPDVNARNMLRFASDPQFASKLANWEEVVSVGISVFKGHHLGAETLEAPSSFFQQILQDLTRGDAQYVSRFFQLFERVAPATAKVRWGYSVIWDEPDIGRLHFQALITEANEPRGHGFNDWVPVDAETWERLAVLVKRFEP